MQEIEVRNWCDQHHRAKGERVEARTVQFDGRELELCEVCEKEFIEPARELLLVLGRKPAEAVKRNPGRPRKEGAVAVAGAQKPQHGVKTVRDHECPLCDYSSAKSSNVHAHVNSRHGMQWSEVLGTTCPLCNHTGVRVFPTHAAQAHGTTAKQTIDAALAAGDEFGVVATLAAHWQELRTDN